MPKIYTALILSSFILLSACTKPASTPSAHIGYEATLYSEIYANAAVDNVNNRQFFNTLGECYAREVAIHREFKGHVVSTLCVDHTDKTPDPDNTYFARHAWLADKPCPADHRKYCKLSK